MQPTKLTEAFIRQLAFEGKPVVVRDTTVKGLMVAVNKHSKHSRYSATSGSDSAARSRPSGTLRAHAELTLDDARTLAMEVIAQIKKGVDPNAGAAAVETNDKGSTWEPAVTAVLCCDTGPAGPIGSSAI